MNEIYKKKKNQVFQFRISSMNFMKLSSLPSSPPNNFYIKNAAIFLKGQCDLWSHAGLIALLSSALSFAEPL